MAYTLKDDDDDDDDDDDFQPGNLTTSYGSSAVLRSSELRKLARNLASVFGSTCTCEQTSLCIKQNKSKFSSRITDLHLDDVMGIGISKIETN
jgi:hypothetical protein